MNIENTDWQYVSMIPKKEMMRNIDRATVLWMLTTGLLCLAAFLISRRVSASLTKPILVLSEAIKDGNHLMLQPDIYPIDLEPVINAYNEDMERINRLVKQNIAIRQQSRKFEVELLSMQIHPHFLYNALNILHWEAKKNACISVEKGIEALSVYLKLSLENKGELVPLREELEHVAEYIKLQNIRYDGFVEWGVRIPDVYMGILLPRFTLQPLAENCIKHGILLKEEEKGSIILSAAEKDGNLVLCMEDDGVGISPEKLQQLNNELYDGTRNLCGIGLYYVNMRLRLLFGMEYHLMVESQEGVYTKIYIPAPLLLASDGGEETVDSDFDCG